MVRSGLQRDVINLYRQGVRNAMSKPAHYAVCRGMQAEIQEAREAFMLHWRYSFRHPALKKRDYAAIEHQIRRLSRTLEMLESPSVNRISVSQDMRDWWASTIAAPTSNPSSGPIPARAATGSRTLYTSSTSSALHSFTCTPTSAPSNVLAAAYHSSTRHYSSAVGQNNGQSSKGNEGNDAPGTGQIGETALEKGETKGDSEPNKTMKEGGSEPTKKSGREKERGDQQWGGKLPGHGGT